MSPLAFLLPCLLVGAATAEGGPGVGWKVLKGRDNTKDLTACCHTGLNISTLKAQCEANKWCAGFSSFYGQLKYDTGTTGPQANTDLYIRTPAPPKPDTVPLFLWPVTHPLHHSPFTFTLRSNWGPRTLTGTEHPIRGPPEHVCHSRSTVLL